MEGWVAVTHQDWFDFLASSGEHEEVNFWTPSDRYAFRGTPGAPFFFKLKAPRNAIGGFGYFSRFARLPDWLAWECFGMGNGAGSYDEFKNRLDELRQRNRMGGNRGLTQIGCIILSAPVFFPEGSWIPQPVDWPVRNLRNKRYDLAVGEGKRVWQQCLTQAAVRAPGHGGELVAREYRQRFGDPVLVAPRLGQGTFRVVVTEAYGRACAVTGEHSLPALEAAHIRPYGRDGPHDVRNGLLLRSDLHRLFDRGYVTVTPECTFEVSRRLRTDFENGHSYYPFHGKRIVVPGRQAEHPAVDFLRWHNEEVFVE